VGRLGRGEVGGRGGRNLDCLVGSLGGAVGHWFFCRANAGPMHGAMQGVSRPDVLNEIIKSRSCRDNFYRQVLKCNMYNVP
jgi:hypothetical protein